MLTKDQIFAASDLQTEVVDVPEWGGSVRICVLSGIERDKFESVFAKDKSNVRGYLAALSIVDEKNERVFKDEDALKLGHKSAAALDRVFSAALKLNAFTQRDVDDLEKN